MVVIFCFSSLGIKKYAINYTRNIFRTSELLRLPVAALRVVGTHKLMNKNWTDGRTDGKHHILRPSTEGSHYTCNRQ